MPEWPPTSPLTEQAPGHMAGRNGFPARSGWAFHVMPPAAAQVELAPFLGIEIDQVPAAQGAGLQPAAPPMPASSTVSSTSGRMHQIRNLPRASASARPMPVVRPQGGVLGQQPAVLQNRPDRIALEVMPVPAFCWHTMSRCPAAPPRAGRATGLAAAQDQVAAPSTSLSSPRRRPGQQNARAARLPASRGGNGAEGGEVVPTGGVPGAGRRGRHARRSAAAGRDAGRIIAHAA